MSEMQTAADGIRVFMRSLRNLEKFLDEAGSIQNAANEAQARLSRLKGEEEEFLSERGKKEAEIAARAAAKAADLNATEETLRTAKESLAIAKEILRGVEEEISRKREELAGIEGRLAELRAAILRSDSPTKGGAR